MDVFSRMILSYRIFNSMHQSYCIETLEEGIQIFQNPKCSIQTKTNLQENNSFKLFYEMELYYQKTEKRRAFDNIHISLYS
ncbi:MAG: hypothetical protein PHC34_04600 [Candidatus Gastranaerophilales bacterium]|nr:hypothetical protein [Candidatus Gastranaerophilales bacterium]